MNFNAAIDDSLKQQQQQKNDKNKYAFQLCKYLHNKDLNK